MPNLDQQSGEAQLPAAPATETLNARGAARRRFTRVGAGASGVLLTLASQPGMAAVCATPSGSLSTGMTSRAPNTAVTCGGFSPGNRKKGKWPQGADKDALFGTIFPCSANSSVMAGLTMHAVLTNNDESVDKHNTGAHVVAAYLNFLDKPSYVITPAILSKIWKEYQDTGGQEFGYYVPSVNHQWFGDDIVQYIRSTFHQ